MRLIRYALSLLVVLLLCTAPASAQRTQKIEKRAAAKVEKLNDSIVAVDASAALTAEQRQEIQALYVAMLTDIRKAKQSDGEEEDVEEEVEEIRRTANRAVDDLLTVAQRSAKKKKRTKE